MRECDGCPFRLWPVRCHAAVVSHRRYCELVAMGRADYVAIVEAKTLGLDHSVAPNKMVEAPPNPWRVAILAMRACPHHVRPACGCDGGDCTREDKAGPTNLARCAECLGMPLPVVAT